MNTATILRGDAVTVLRTLPDNSVHCCVTSPPYYGLRDYGTATWEGGDPECDHKVGIFTTPASDKQRSNSGSGDMQAAHICPRCGAIRIDKQIGLEDTPAEYVERLVAVFREVRRVLRDDGVCWLNLGDTYYNVRPGSGGKCVLPGAGKAMTEARYTNIVRDNGDAKPKDLLGIPWRVAFALQDAGWWLRQDIIWHKPNPMPESVTDRCTKAHEYVFLLTKSARYYYDAQAIAEPTEQPERIGKIEHTFSTSNGDSTLRHDIGRSVMRTATRNKRSVWTIATEPTPYAHFATMPTALAETCILAGCPAQVCAECGAPWVRVVEKGERIQAHWKNTEQAKAKAAKGKHGATSVIETGSYQTYETIGFAPTCTCDAGTIPGTVLDPFAGSGTTLRVAVELGRNAIGIELNPEYAALAEQLIAQTQPALLPL